ncbi:MAG: hypothetical protein JWM62_3475, partial [Frankiales bacterium]|nr:hypothetical protein [Frankiales bacterium]
DGQGLAVGPGPSSAHKHLTVSASTGLAARDVGHTEPPDSAKVKPLDDRVCGGCCSSGEVVPALVRRADHKARREVRQHVYLHLVHDCVVVPVGHPVIRRPKVPPTLVPQLGMALARGQPGVRVRLRVDARTAKAARRLGRRELARAVDPSVRPNLARRPKPMLQFNGGGAQEAPARRHTPTLQRPCRT